MLVRALILSLAVMGVDVWSRAAIAQPATQPTAAQQRLLQAAGLRLALPTWVPAGFELTTVQVQADRQTRIGGLTYTAIYQRYDRATQRTTCFAIEATNGGIGGLPPGRQRYPVNSPVFGRTTLEVGRYGEASRPSLLSNWLGTGPFYRLVGAAVIPALARCENVTPQQAVQILESLQYHDR